MNQTLVRFKRTFLYRLFPFFAGTFFVALSLVAAFSVSCCYASKASAPYWNSGSTLASSIGLTASTLPMFSFSALPYLSGTVLPLLQAVPFFLLRHPHTLRCQTAAFSLPEKASLSVLSLRTSSLRIPFPVYSERYGKCWRSSIQLLSCPCRKRQSSQWSYPHLL